MFSYFQSNPERARCFRAGMKAAHARGGYEISHLIENLPISSRSGPVTVVDVGGSHGETMVKLAEHNTDAKCTVQDLPSTIDKHIPLQGEMAERVSFMEHDFFEEQPVKGAGFYLLRNVLHNWSDGDCMKILRSLIPALGADSKIIVNDWCIPRKTLDVSWQERKARYDPSLLKTRHNQR